MRAVVLDRVGSVAVRDVPEPVPQEPDDAIVRVAMSAICGSDLHFVHGKAPLDPGQTIGHEAVGIVERVGPGVERVREGDRVVASFLIACGLCWFCLRGQTQLCDELNILGVGIFGGDLGGAQAELVRVPHADTNLLALPDDVPDDRAIFVGDALATGVYAAALSGIGPGDVVAVVGAGPTGFLIAQAARRAGADVLALDLEPDRLALAERFGVAAVDVRGRHPQVAVAERTDGRGADVAIEAVGTPAAFETAVDVVRRGGVVTIIGIFAGETIPISAGVYGARALDVRFAGLTPVHSWWRRALEDVRSGAIDPVALVSHRLPLDEAPRGYELFHARRATKVLLLP